MAQSSIQDTLDRVSKHKSQAPASKAASWLHDDAITFRHGVLGLVIAGNDGSVHKSTLDEHLTQEYSSMIPQLTALARITVRELDPQNELEFLRVRSVKHEVMVAPKGEYVLIVIQDTNDAA